MSINFSNTYYTHQKLSDFLLQLKNYQYILYNISKVGFTWNYIYMAHISFLYTADQCQMYIKRQKWCAHSQGTSLYSWMNLYNWLTLLLSFTSKINCHWGEFTAFLFLGGPLYCNNKILKHTLYSRVSYILTMYAQQRQWRLVLFFTVPSLHLPSGSLWLGRC